MLMRSPVARSGGHGSVRAGGTPLGISATMGAVVVVIASFVAAAVPSADPGLRLALVAAAVGGVALVTPEPPALGLVLTVAFGLLNGFLVNRLGDLSWHGTADLARLSVLVLAATCGLVLGWCYRRWHPTTEEKNGA